MGAGVFNHGEHCNEVGEGSWPRQMSGRWRRFYFVYNQMGGWGHQCRLLEAWGMGKRRRWENWQKGPLLGLFRYWGNNNHLRLLGGDFPRSQWDITPYWDSECWYQWKWCQYWFNVNWCWLWMIWCWIHIHWYWSKGFLLCINAGDLHGNCR